MRKVTLRTQFPENYDTNKASDSAGLDTGTEGGAKQSFKDECDINVILKRFGIGYEIPPGLRVPQYGDFTGINNFHDAANAIAQANENFDMLPAHIRAKFQNEPEQFVQFAIDEKNWDELNSMGLISKEAQERRRITQERAREQEQARDKDKSKSASKGSPAQPPNENA